MAGQKRFTGTLASGVTDENLVARTILERLVARPEMVSIWGVVEGDPATPGDADLFTLELRLGNVVVVDPGPLELSNNGLRRNEHFVGEGVGAPGDLVQVKLHNGAAGPLTYRILVRETAIA